jgi:hypothetical protein
LAQARGSTAVTMDGRDTGAALVMAGTVTVTSVTVPGPHMWDAELLVAAPYAAARRM